MLVRNIEPRLIRLDGVFIAPNQEIEVAENAVGLASLLERGTLIQMICTPKVGLNNQLIKVQIFYD
ncbi:hypothetical protein [Avibacterium paragallinarum]|uniref:hypothetical protein n=1 Tax=Avibacterium paragallinarum TaxID=728 RepID=UPI001029EE55|nr:hypothetical protein [Avibacterium paragallinarum]RZN54096.1 hypothetical protein EIG78_11855 [Avibacterium paragallinarum]